MNTAQTEHETLDAKLRAAGMLSVADLLKGAPLDSFIKHAGVTDFPSLITWAEMRRAEYLRQVALYELGERDKNDDLYEWVIAHSAAFNELHVNLRSLLPESLQDFAKELSALQECLGSIKSQMSALSERSIREKRSALRMIEALARARESLAQHGVSVDGLQHDALGEIDNVLQDAESVFGPQPVPTLN